jgi:hypothetical protein
VPLDFETLTQFLEVANIDVRLRDTKGRTVMFSPDDPDMREYVAKTESFYYNGKSYNRADFEQVVARVLAGENPRRR